MVADIEAAFAKDDKKEAGRKGHATVDGDKGSIYKVVLRIS